MLPEVLDAADISPAKLWALPCLHAALPSCAEAAAVCAITFAGDLCLFVAVTDTGLVGEVGI